MNFATAPDADLSEDPAMQNDLFDTPEHESFRDTIRRFVAEELAPRAREFDQMGRIDKALFKKMGDLGILGLRYDPEWGGAGLDWSFTTVLFEELGRSDNAGVTMGISVHTLRNWEQGRRTPEGPAKSLLRIAARHPRILRENLESAA